jgi:hypothetical protein
VSASGFGQLPGILVLVDAVLQRRSEVEDLAASAEDGGNRALNAGNYRNTHTTAITVLKCGHSGKMKFLLGVNETFNTP